MSILRARSHIKWVCVCVNWGKSGPMKKWKQGDSRSRIIQHLHLFNTRIALFWGRQCFDGTVIPVVNTSLIPVLVHVCVWLWRTVCGTVCSSMCVCVLRQSWTSLTADMLCYGGAAGGGKAYVTPKPRCLLMFILLHRFYIHVFSHIMLMLMFILLPILSCSYIVQHMHYVDPSSYS